MTGAGTASPTGYDEVRAVHTAFPASVRRAIREAIDAFDLGGMALAVARGDRPAECLVVGDDPNGQPLRVDSLFPVASVTKLATALAVLRPASARRLDVHDPLERHLPDALASASGVTLPMLFTHTSGLPADHPEELAPYRDGMDWPLLARAYLRTPLAEPPRTSVSYSNVGYGLLAIVAERCSGLPFPRALRALVLDPLGIEGYLGAEPPRSVVPIADVRGRHVGTWYESINSHFWRSIGRPSGGLITTVSGALALVRAYRGVPNGFLSAALLAEATRDQTGGLSGGISGFSAGPSYPWGLGPELRNGKEPYFAPAEASAHSFGHSGYSGSIVWADPDADLAWALLAPRTMENGWLVEGGRSVGAAILAANRG